jgi:sugar phosphate isomerase/epimerase
MRRVALLFVIAASLLAPSTGFGQTKPIPKPQINQAALDKLGWKLGCQAWTFRKLSLFETIDLLNELGIRYIELYPGQTLMPGKATKLDHNSPPADVDALIAKLKEKNVTAVSYGVVGLNNDEAAARKVFDFAKKLGLTQVVSEPPADSFEMLDKLTGEYQINLAIHDHPKPSHYWNPDAVLEVCKGRSSRIGACADVGHWYRSGLVSLDSLKKLDGHVIELHFKDVDETKEDVVWGTGKIDVAALMAEVQRQGIHPLFAIEYEKGEGDELIANVSRSIEFFSKTATDLAAKER